MNCAYCVHPVDLSSKWGWWSITDILGFPGGFVPVHEDCRKYWDRTAIPPIGVDIIPKITVEHIRLTHSNDAK